MKKIFLIILFFSLFCSVSSAQDIYKDSASIQVISRFTGSEVMLRFAPSTPFLWRTMYKNKIGYTIEKTYILEDKLVKEIITKSPILPYTLEEWKTKTNTNNTYVSAAAEAMYGTVSVNTKEIKSPFETAVATENEMQMRFAYAMLSADIEKEAAQGLGLFFKEEIKQTEGWALYSIYPSQKIEGIEVDTAIIRVDFTQKYEPYPVAGVWTEEGEQAVTIAWDKEANKGFSAFRVEKSMDGTNFIKIGENPTLTDENIPYHFYIDSVTQNYKKASYRVIGITPFGDVGLSSPTVEGQGIDLSAAAGFGGIFTENLPDGTVRVSWEVIAEQPDLEGYYVAKALDVEHEFIYINENPIKGKHQFIDKNPERVFNSYYTVYAHDTHGNISKSMTTMHMISDSIAPLQPKNLKGIIDSLGIARLTWDEGTEADLRGYRVYYANAKDREFVQLTIEPIANDVFSDTLVLNTLSNKIYYKIAAIDLRYNASDYSEILELSKPDTIPPTSPFIAFYNVDDKGIRLDFKRSSSEDVVSHQVLRKDQKENAKWETLAVFEAEKDTVHHFLDAKVEKGKWYEYAIQAKDQSANASKLVVMPIQFFDNGKTNFVPTLKAEYSKTDKHLRLFWEGKEWKNKQQKEFQVMILRKEQEDEFVALTTIQANEYIDYSLYDNQKGFVYVIKLIYADGSESELSNQVKIDLK